MMHGDAREMLGEQLLHSEQVHDQLCRAGGVLHGLHLSQAVGQTLQSQRGHRRLRLCNGLAGLSAQSPRSLAHFPRVAHGVGGALQGLAGPVARPRPRRCVPQRLASEGFAGPAQCLVCVAVRHASELLGLSTGCGPQRLGAFAAAHGALAAGGPGRHLRAAGWTLRELQRRHAQLLRPCGRRGLPSLEDSVQHVCSATLGVGPMAPRAIPGVGQVLLVALLEPLQPVLVVLAPVIELLEQAGAAKAAELAQRAGATQHVLLGRLPGPGHEPFKRLRAGRGPQQHVVLQHTERASRLPHEPALCKPEQKMRLGELRQHALPLRLRRIGCLGDRRRLARNGRRTGDRRPLALKGDRAPLLRSRHAISQLPSSAVALPTVLPPTVPLPAVILI
mmetsp:Transcript_6703/g.18934  ORF Transcript_6703/g.18934 Transcript_6703/m.18934 type:complete len:391 (-) Transcript_6703:45-1217(-)